MKAIAPYLLPLLALLYTACEKQPLAETIPPPASLWVSQLAEGDTLLALAGCLQTIQVEVRGASLKATYAWSPGNARTNRLEVNRNGTGEQQYQYQVTITDTDAVYQRVVLVHFDDTEAFTKEPYIYQTLVPRGGGAYLIEKPECAHWVRMALYDSDTGDEVYRYNGAGRPLWDGRYKGRPAPTGYYYYTLELIFHDGSQSQYDGVVELLR